MKRVLLGIIVLLLGCQAVSALAWDEPKHWAEIGSVSTWIEMDQRFYRAFDETRYHDRSQFKTDQQKEYGKILISDSTEPALPLEAFQALSADEQASRVKEARKRLDFLRRFRERLEGMIQRTRQNQSSGWGNQTTDHTVVGDCLKRLRTAVGLDPSNPYAWHLLAYFSAVAGDLERSLAALDGCDAALAAIPAGELTNIRRRAALDRTWIMRDAGLFDEATSTLDVAEQLGEADIETRLLRGLISAQTGQVQQALSIAGELGSVEIRKFPPDFRSTSFSPELNNILNWKKISSAYLSSWIKALSWLQQGDPVTAAAAFGEYSLDDHYPFQHRFWNDAGRIYAMTDRLQRADQAWNVARLSIPYQVFFVYKPYQMGLGKLTGSTEKLPFFLGFDRFYLVGARLAYGAALVGKLSETTDEFEKQEWALLALDQLDISQRQGIYPGPSSVLQGQVYYLMGDYDSAMIELEEALVHFEKSGEEAYYAAVLEGLTAIRANRSKEEVDRFYSQSGTSTGRWAAEGNPEQVLADLRQAWATSPTDENRRALARHLIRHDELQEGRTLALGDSAGKPATSNMLAGMDSADLELVLEADRTIRSATLAQALVKELRAGRGDTWPDAGMWSLVGFICLDHEDTPAGREALEQAAKLDPGNQGLQTQLRMMGD